MLTVARRAAEAAEESGRRRTPRRSSPPPLEAGAAAWPRPPSCWTCCARRASSTRAASGVVILLEGLAASLAGRRAGAGRARRAAAGRRRRPPALALPLLHELPRGGRRDRPRRPGGRPARVGDSVLVMGDPARRRSTSTPTRPSGPPRSRAEWGDVERHDARRHAPAGGRAGRPAAPCVRARARCGALLLADGAGVRELARGARRRRLPPGAGAAGIEAARSGLAADEAVIVAVGRVDPPPPSSRPPRSRRCSPCLVALDPERRRDRERGRDGRRRGGGHRVDDRRPARRAARGPGARPRRAARRRAPRWSRCSSARGRAWRPPRSRPGCGRLAGEPTSRSRPIFGGQARPALAIGVE